MLTNLKYKGYKICQNTKQIWHKNKLTKQQWSENIPLKTFSILGPFTIHTIHNKFRSVKTAMKEIDFLIRFGLNLPQNNGC